ncbi:MAG: FixH family protein [Bacteroidia bacterium]|nr:FixH family protein [Bacteroidia bacterium]
MAKSKFNWGWGIFIVIMLFFGTIILRLILSIGIGDDVITKDYYHKELNYETEIQKKKNTNLLNSKIQLLQSNNLIEIKFPDEFKHNTIKGTILFYCASKNDKDLLYKIEPDSNNVQKFSKSNFTEKRYKIKIDWYSDSVSYYQEFNFNM